MKVKSDHRNVFYAVVYQTKMKSEGKYVNLPGASQGNVVTRFPPEASG